MQKNRSWNPPPYLSRKIKQKSRQISSFYQWKMVRRPRKSNKQNWRVKIIPEWAKSNPYLLKLSNGCNLVLLSELYHGFISNMNIRSWVRILMVGSGRRSEDQRIQKRSYTIWVSWLFSLYTIDRFTMGGVLSKHRGVTYYVDDKIELYYQKFKGFGGWKNCKLARFRYMYYSRNLEGQKKA